MWMFLLNSTEFQFHYGSIRTADLQAEILKVHNPDGFNSTMVRLELEFVITKNEELQGFQFHYGSIRTTANGNSSCCFR